MARHQERLSALQSRASAPSASLMSPVRPAMVLALRSGPDCTDRAGRHNWSFLDFAVSSERSGRGPATNLPVRIRSVGRSKRASEEVRELLALELPSAPVMSVGSVVNAAGSHTMTSSCCSPVVSPVMKASTMSPMAKRWVMIGTGRRLHGGDEPLPAFPCPQDRAWSRCGGRSGRRRTSALRSRRSGPEDAPRRIGDQCGRRALGQG